MNTFLRRAAASVMLSATAMVATVAHAQDLPLPTLKSGGGKYLKDSKTIIIPTINLNLAVEGSAWSKGKVGDKNSQAHGKYAVKGIEKAMAQTLAKQIVDDLATRLKAIGFTVLTYDDIKADESVVKMDRYKADANYGMPKLGFRGMGVDYLLATPSDAQAFDPPIQGPHWSFRNVAKARNAIVMVPEMWILSPQMWGEKEEGYKRVSTSVNIAPGMNVRSAWVFFINPKAAGGNIQTEKEMANLAEKAGTLGETSKDETDMSWLKRTSAAWKMTVDPAEYTAGVMRGAVAFNKALVEAIQKEIK